MLALAQVNTEWVARFHGGGADRARSVAIDDAGNVYVTGESASPAAGLDIVTVKYDPEGTQQWARTYNGPGNADDSGGAIAVDGSANAYVTGYSTGAGSAEQDYVLIKYDTDGVEQWVRRYNGPVSSWDEALAIALDSEGGVLVTGRSNPTGLWFDFDYLTIKYDSDGTQIWLDRFDGPGHDWDQANAIAVDGAGNAYVTGTMSQDVGTAYHDYATIMFDASGKRQWIRTFNGVGNNWDEAVGVGFDDLGNVYVTGFTSGSGTVYDYTTVKYSPNGTEQWARVYNRPGSGLSADVARDMVVSGDGDVYVTGPSGLDYGTVKYDSQGDEVWTARFGSSSADDLANSIALDAFGGVYVTGISAHNFVTVKYDAIIGNEDWTTVYNGPGHGDDTANWVSVDAAGQVYVTGASLGAGSGEDYATVKYSQPLTSVEPGANELGTIGWLGRCGVRVVRPRACLVILSALVSAC